MKRALCAAACSVLFGVLGCGTQTISPSFTIAAGPSVVTLTNGGETQHLAVTAAGTNGFQEAVQISLSGLPAGVTATPMTVMVTPGKVQDFTLSASGASASSTATLTLMGTASTLTASTTVGLTIAPAPVITTAILSATTFSFGNDLVGTAMTQQVVTVENVGADVLTLSPTVSGNASFSLAGATVCGSTLAAGASCTVGVTYLPTVASGATPQSGTLDLGFGNVPPATPHTVALSGIAAVMPPATVAKTNNSQVALYTWTLPFPGTMVVNFGPDTTYGLKTWTQTSTANNRTVTTFVAGMRANTTYHLQGHVDFGGGLTTTDVDHTFATGTPTVQPQLTATTTPGMTPQPGVEELDGVNLAANGLAITDLSGNVLWAYKDPDMPGVTGGSIQGAKLLSNGNFLIGFGSGSSEALGGPPPSGVNVAVREINLAGDIVKEISLLDLNAELTTAGYDFQLLTFHHDVTPLPNGHWLVLGNTTRQFTDLVGYPGTTTVLGDVIVDLDTNLQPVWVWNEFDHLDVNRHPMNFPDWTHTNAVVYSKDDGNLIVSMRHQNWVVKVDYKNGTGAGDVLWRLGEGGDFALKGGTDPTDWQYAQHYPSIASTNTSGVFSLILMDNGNDRMFPAGVTCGTTGGPPCLYTTIPLFQLDETAKTATLMFHQMIPTSMYNNFGGSADVLANGNVEFDLCGVGGVGGTSDIYEVTQTSTPETVWHMSSNSGNLYRAYRIPSLYPGVQW